MSKETAVELNNRIAFSSDPLVPAVPFDFAGSDTDRADALECLTAAVYHEAAGEGVRGQQAIAQTVLNRVRSPSFPSTICGVVYQGSLLPTGCQFSFTCDGSLARNIRKAEWLSAREIAMQALDGAVMPAVGLSTHYHTIDVLPYWASSLVKDARLGRHIFYRWPGTWGSPAAFRQAYVGRESGAAILRATALVAHGIWPREQPGATEAALQVGIDHEAEVLGILQLLGAPAAVEPPLLERAVRSRFNHWAPTPVASKAAASPSDEPVATEKNTASVVAKPQRVDVRPLVASSAFRTFLRQHRREYKIAADQLGEILAQGVSTWQIYSGVEVAPAPVSVSLMWGLAEPRCALLELGSSANKRTVPSRAANHLRLPGLLLGSGAADDLVDSLMQPKGHGQLRKTLSAVQKDLTYAVFARSAALSGNADAEKAILRDALARGFNLAPLLARRLRYFEKHRAQYPTLGSFVPLLIRNLPSVQQAQQRAQPAGSAEKVGQCTTMHRLVTIAESARRGSPKPAADPVRS